MSNLQMPSMGLGTFRLSGSQLTQAIHHALDLGFRHIDTAQIYDNEAEVGQAIADSPVKREDSFITTKVWIDNLHPDKFMASVENSLEKLQTDYVDLLLIHWPSPKDKVAMDAYMTELNNCKFKGMTRAIGVSNFTPKLLEQAFASIGKESIEVNQVEVHPYFQNQHLVNYCQSNGVNIVGYMPLGNKQILDDEVLKAIAAKHHKSVAQIALAWQMQQNIATIPASTSREHLQENLLASELRLTPEEMDTIAKLDTGRRLIDPDFAPDW